MRPSPFTLLATDHQARAGEWLTRRGKILTPTFMPVATQAAIKGAVSFEELNQTGAQICLGNTYHLHLRPGSALVKKAGGLHAFMGWDKPILTDSGGFQVFSIAQRKITDQGVYFRSHINGDRFYLDAETSIQIQHQLGSDILMAFDECPPSTNSPRKIQRAVERTTAWAQRSLAAHQAVYPLEQSFESRPQLFGIVQGGCENHWREKSLAEITSLPFDGYALGGLAVGEPNDSMYQVLEAFAPRLPHDRVRYLMGVGTPSDLLRAIGYGIDIFDCVLPCRNARHGLVYTWEGRLSIKQARYREDFQVLDPQSTGAMTKKGLTRAYLHHLLRANEDLARRYLTLQNLTFYQELVQRARQEILRGNFDSWSQSCLQRWQ